MPHIFGHRQACRPQRWYDLDMDNTIPTKPSWLSSNDNSLLVWTRHRPRHTLTYLEVAEPIRKFDNLKELCRRSSLPSNCQTRHGSYYDNGDDDDDDDDGDDTFIHTSFSS
ncbi:hypothetical protein DPMN_192232 [Dreissena polymorpha]|uniref:Uncharacterized protein n=1 Tax=Dreissena polymorpha TaxID=45954 RepID=A0A9D3Y0T0_DREPO|nr:hypothetical protein DPMN_192232 [Dreissena polymorpha]